MPSTLSSLAPVSPQPLVTFYDLATGERVELSGITLGNWVAKATNYLTEDLEIESGARVRIGLPPHWLRPVWVLATWTAGAVVADSEAEVAVVGPDLDADEPIRLAASLRPLGARFAEPPEGFTDIAAVVPPQPDVLLTIDSPGPDDVAIDLGGAERSHAEVLAVAADDRRLLLGDPELAEEIDALVAACRGTGSLVITVGGTDDDRARIAAQEHAERP
ncbi:TIGR03089 family protein [Aeromicrobium sp. PE09-221]|uniref:TIGR03089 family protein n=1 Tax=Aeromicrobium sp. PE09-221 TaxID=1898043 RepID=UPI000B70EB82|nr:TIGR03089 family protein [Aeromicrobium sp. PE09-221]OUZ08545.1 TIGR03089 family protein [Aeromicrobium sp. PE09-221]